MHELSVGLWFLHSSELSVQSCRCSERASFGKGSCHRSHLSICKEISLICSLLQPSKANLEGEEAAEVALNPSLTDAGCKGHR